MPCAKIAHYQLLILHFSTRFKWDMQMWKNNCLCSLAGRWQGQDLHMYQEDEGVVCRSCRIDCNVEAAFRMMHLEDKSGAFLVFLLALVCSCSWHSFGLE